MAVGSEKVIYTTNAEDQNAVAALQRKIAQSNADATNNGDTTSSAGQEWKHVPSVSIDEGTHKYVLISATEPYPQAQSNCKECFTQFFVTSKRGAAYHRNAAEPYVEILQENGYRDINVQGGGRIYCNTDESMIKIYGYSYGFGLGDHAKSKEVIEGYVDVDGNKKFDGFDISWTNDGY